jgi:threonyl-tRNA synthetase
MTKIELEFPDGSKKEYDKGTNGLEIAQKIGERLANDAIAVKLDDELIDLKKPIEKNGKFQILTFKDKEGKDIFWHSASHLMSQAVLRVFKGQNIGLGVGTAVENGFYQDYGMKPLHPEDLKKIEEEMKKIVDEKLEIKQRNIPKKEAIEFYKEDPYKIELANAVPGDIVSMYSQGEFDNLCKGPHLPNTKKIKAFKLMKVAGAYWRGDSKNNQLQRIYGVAFPDKKDLKKYLNLIEEAEKRDHRKIGKTLELFSIHDEGPGFPFFLPKGVTIINILQNFWRKEHKKAGYVEIKTPMILSRTLWEQSGHWGHYKENMYFTKIDDHDFAVKPMNCPGGILIFKEKVHSYRELPIRAGEMGIVHRHELSGVLTGLFRVRCFTQDDAHIFMTEEQIKDEIIGVINLTNKFYKLFGFEYHVELSTKPEKALGSAKVWETAEKGLEDAMKSMGIKYKINPGDGAFYGPKIDFHLKDCLGRTWQCGTIQLDFAMPEKFDLTYEGKDGKKHRPVMIHRVIYGSIERFLGILIEHFKGRFPLWITPVQVRVIGIADRHQKYVDEIMKKLEDNDIRVETDTRAETINKKVKEAQVQQIPIIIVCGDKEIEKNSLNIRTLDGKLKPDVKIESLIKVIKDNVKKQTIEPDLSEL